MKIVLDTNVLVIALRSRRGASFRLLSELPAKDFEIVLTIPLYTEYQDALSRPQILELGYSQNDIKELTRYLASISHKQEIYYLWRPWLKDPKDDMVLEAAFASQSEYIVTYNTKDFVGKGIEKSFGIKPVNAKEFLMELGRIKK
ncbi:putative toxin-antitoxin system toxin component, PIN family [Granulosicoccus sp.]|nr:putative toxin-antitoxin system toxin component, PIN family [Granulosicoccus sp.]MDB4224466.1 putative toxin-antitoxin system toxin component, PIN family [Granulosicoccus sp.]